MCVCLVTLWLGYWLDAVYAHLGLYVNQLTYIIYMFKNRQTDPKPAQILSTAQANIYPHNKIQNRPIWQHCPWTGRPMSGDFEKSSSGRLLQYSSLYLQ